jgi:hypothetical protein
MKSQTQKMTRNRRLATMTLIGICLTCTVTLLTSIGSRKASAASIFHVITTADNGDNNNPTPGSLRQAILDANANPGADLIDFQIPASGVQTINLTAALPVINGAVTIDGYTQSGASANTLANGNNAVLLIELNGAGIASSFKNGTAGWLGDRTLGY